MVAQFRNPEQTETSLLFYLSAHPTTQPQLLQVLPSQNLVDPSFLPLPPTYWTSLLSPGLLLLMCPPLLVLLLCRVCPRVIAFKLNLDSSVAHNFGTSHKFLASNLNSLALLPKHFLSSLCLQLHLLSSPHLFC